MRLGLEEWLENAPNKNLVPNESVPKKEQPGLSDKNMVKIKGDKIMQNYTVSICILHNSIKLKTAHLKSRHRIRQSYTTDT